MSASVGSPCPGARWLERHRRRLVAVGRGRRGRACERGYVGTTGEDLKLVSDAPGALPRWSTTLRIDGQTVDGLPRPVFHFVGADAA